MEKKDKELSMKGKSVTFRRVVKWVCMGWLICLVLGVVISILVPPSPVIESSPPSVREPVKTGEEQLRELGYSAGYEVGKGMAEGGELFDPEGHFKLHIAFSQQMGKRLEGSHFDISFLERNYWYKTGFKEGYAAGWDSVVRRK